MQEHSNMARIEGVASGLIGIGSVQEHREETLARARKAKPKQEWQPPEYETTCTACGAYCPPYTQGRSKTPHVAIFDGLCRHCGDFFGRRFMNGCTNADPDEAREKIARAKAEGFVIVLRDLTLVDPSGVQVSVGAGDIFACKPETLAHPAEKSSKETTWGMFTIRLQVGPFTMTLFPHEFGAIDFSTTMSLKAAGEIEESFVCTEDMNGHFQPTPAIREQIVECFGRLINAQRPAAPSRRKRK
jgi:hypothetical protein